MSDLYFYPEDEDHTIPVYNWNWTYAHGDLEADNCHDMGFFSEEKPEKEGFYTGYANHREIMVRLFRRGTDPFLSGRVAYIYDVEAMRYLYDESKWS